jgi:hypothetical protein
MLFVEAPSPNAINPLFSDLSISDYFFPFIFCFFFSNLLFCYVISLCSGKTSSEPRVSMDGNHKQELEDLELFQNHVVDSFF